MFVLNFKLKKRIKLKYIFIILAVIAAVVFACVRNSGASADKATCDEVGEYSLAAQTDEQRLDILSSFGIENAELTESDEITVPEDFNSNTENYNELQKQIGLDLSPYKGQKAQRFTYSLDGENASYAVLLVNNGRLIGGHLTNRVYGESAKPLSG